MNSLQVFFIKFYLYIYYEYLYIHLKFYHENKFLLCHLSSDFFFNDSTYVPSKNFVYYPRLYNHD